MTKPTSKTNKPSKSKASVKKGLSAKVEALESKISELTDDLKRSRADFINFKRQTEDEKLKLIEHGEEVAIKKLLTVVDNLERAVKHFPKDLEGNDWAEGFKKILHQAHETLKAMKVKKFSSLGKDFDPQYHEAVGFEDGKGKKEVVVEELQPGYMYKDKIIRHAIVRVKKQ